MIDLKRKIATILCSTRSCDRASAILKVTSVGCLLLAFLLCVLSCFSPAVYADVKGTCKRCSISGACKQPNHACTITVGGVAKKGKCKSDHVLTIGGICVCTPDDGTSVEETKASAQSSGGISPIPPAPTVMTFDISPRAEGTIWLVPDEFGGGIVPLSFSGFIAGHSIPTGNPDIDIIEVDGGMTTAPSVTFPNGQSTGLNVFEFLSPGSTVGTLNRVTGEFQFSANGRLTNDLFPPDHPIETLGDYFGSVNMTTGEVVVDTRTFDFNPNFDVDNFDSYVDIIDLRGMWNSSAAADVYLETDEELTFDGNSMRVDYSNPGAQFAEVWRSPGDPDFSWGGIKSLSLWFRGDPNVSEICVKLESADGNNYTLCDVSGYPAVDVQLAELQELNFDLSQFVGVNLDQVTKITLSIGTSAAAAGTVYFDEIKLYPVRCFNRPEGDLCRDCVVNFNDFAVFAARWLDTTDIWP